jgi:hypothetical protein
MAIQQDFLAAPVFLCGKERASRVSRRSLTSLMEGEEHGANELERFGNKNRTVVLKVTNATSARRI